MVTGLAYSFGAGDVHSCVAVFEVGLCPRQLTLPPFGQRDVLNKGRKGFGFQDELVSTKRRNLQRETSPRVAGRFTHDDVSGVPEFDVGVHGRVLRVANLSGNTCGFGGRGEKENTTGQQQFALSPRLASAHGIPRQRRRSA